MITVNNTKGLFLYSTCFSVHKAATLTEVNVFGCFCHFRFDTYRAKEESIRLAQYLGRVANGMILSVAVNDEGSRNLDDSARKAMTKLGSKHFLHLGFRYVPVLPVLLEQRLYYAPEMSK